MRDDIYIERVLAKCQVFKQTGHWLSEPNMRPQLWLNNFDNSDKKIAAILLDKFIFYNEKLTNHLLISAYQSICNGYKETCSGQIWKPEDIYQNLDKLVLTPVEGENPNPTDSGNLFCRKARQLLKIPEDKICNHEDALSYAEQGYTVIFLDDFVGSGDQFDKTWKRKVSGSNNSFEMIQLKTNFLAIYIPLVVTSEGISNLKNLRLGVIVNPIHILEKSDTVFGINPSEIDQVKIKIFLSKYSEKLSPQENYIASNKEWKMFGYKKMGAMLGFEHSVPDATLPIFWSAGSNWEPLIERR